MNSRLLICRLEHKRLTPAKHGFKLGLYLYCFDLDDLVHLDKRLMFFGYNRFRPTALHDKDYLYKDKRPIKEKCLDVLRRSGIKDKINRIYLITAARYFNYVFNPVNFYYCYGTGSTLVAVVAEVNNTFGDKHIYILNKNLKNENYFVSYRADKEFHVSPFNKIEGYYEFFLEDIRKNLDIRINLFKERKLVFTAWLYGKDRKLSNWSHIRTILMSPILPILTMPRIIFQAAQLFFIKHLKYIQRPIPESTMTIGKRPPSFIQKWALRITLNMLNRISVGRLQLTLPNGSKVSYSKSTPSAHIWIKDYRFFTMLLFHGDIGFGEAYTEGLWTSDNVPKVLTQIFYNLREISHDSVSASWFRRMAGRFIFFFQRNNLKGSKKNISVHYDLKNEFFALFLDKAKIYSSAFYKRKGETLESAQKNKIHHIIEKARIGKRDHVLEIGCGWGGFAIEAAKRTGCKVTGITVSKRQYEYAIEAVRSEGLSSRVTILFKDYRHVKGTFDKIVSIEMLEAVGHDYFGIYFKTIERLLAPQGLAVIQSITIPDFRYNAYRKSFDWIKKHIFPGGLLPSVDIISSVLAKETELHIEDLENIGPHYALTLAEWRKRFLANKKKVLALGFDNEFILKWEYYLASCEALFKSRCLNNIQFVLSRPCNRSLDKETLFNN